MNGATLALILLLVFVVQGLAIAATAVEVTHVNGRKAMYRGVAISVVVSAIAGYLWTLIVPVSPVLSALGFAVVEGFFALDFARRAEARVREQLKMASTVARFGLENFRRFDRENKGEFGSAHLHDALAEQSFSEGDRWLIDHLQRHISDVGHKSNVQLVSAMHHSTVVVTYAITRRDLETYETRLNKLYAAWL